jgi:hypothetical protein
MTAVLAFDIFKKTLKIPIFFLDLLSPQFTGQFRSNVQPSCS